MPMPHKNESKEQYISRCIPYMIDKEGKKQDQAVAMCHAFWKEYGPAKDESVNMDIVDKIGTYLLEDSNKAYSYANRLSGRVKTFAYDYIDFKIKQKLHKTAPLPVDYGIRQVQGKEIIKRLDSMLVESPVKFRRQW